MGWEFRKSINIIPGVKINLSRSGPSISLGPKGMKYNIGSRGTRVRYSIPGTGIYYTKNLSNTVNVNRNTISYEFPIWLKEASSKGIVKK